MRGFRPLPALVAALAVSALALSGCGDSITMSEAPGIDDEETLRSFVDDHGFFDESELYEGEIESAGGEVGGSREPIDPVRFWRTITDRIVTREVHIDPEEGTADLTVTKEVWGTLNIVDSDTVRYEKPMHHTGVRYATFERVDDWTPWHGNGNGNAGENGSGDQNTDRYRHRRGPWRLSAISGLLASSEMTTMGIDWIRVQSATVDVTITDPLLLMEVPGEIMQFELGEEVTVTVSGPPADALVMLHTRRHRSWFEYEGGVFVGTWTVAHSGVHCAAVQALAHDSIYDSEYPDDCMIWGMPYEVGRRAEDE